MQAAVWSPLQKQVRVRKQPPRPLISAGVKQRCSSLLQESPRGKTEPGVSTAGKHIRADTGKGQVCRRGTHDLAIPTSTGRVLKALETFLRAPTSLSPPKLAHPQVAAPCPSSCDKQDSVGNQNGTRICFTIKGRKLQVTLTASGPEQTVEQITKKHCHLVHIYPRVSETGSRII